ncbi:MAG: hypothetical protein Barrevirus11_19 [Barrevirus sp.]|uniref:Uncharacterized protein n=1 Tax=Barrevirus sp. TaxID=2487763 RepID=A0A3G4ZUK0_9VIRU|nr:MAG: hypothetical protein Barrevirus11_19 [Barrevirus sp.]
MLFVALFLSLCSSSQLITLDKSKDIYVLTSFNANTCYTVDVNIDIYCNSVYASSPLSYISLVLKEDKYGSDIPNIISHSFGRNGIHKGTINIYNNSYVSKVIIMRGNGCYNADLDITINQFKIYTKECPIRPSGFAMMFMASCFLFMLVMIVYGICELCCCECKGLRYMH